MDITIFQTSIVLQPQAVVQPPAEQPYGDRACAFRDPSGNLLRIEERR